MRMPKWVKKLIFIADRIAEPYVPPPFRYIEDFVVHEVLKIKDTTLPAAEKRKQVKKILSKI